MAHPHVTTIVVNWKLKEETVRCLRSLEQLDLPCHVIVVDNGSCDGSAEYLVRRFPQAELIALNSNVGFGAACNRAITRALNDAFCDYVFLLNNDAVVHPRTLSELISVAQAHPEAGIFGPKIYCQDEPRTVWYAGARRRRGVLAAADTGRDRLDRGQFNTLRDVDYVFGTAMFIRRGVLERVGLFDERFFLYLEDLDFCLRAQAVGFSLLFVPEAHVWHKGSASTAHNKAMRRYHMARSTVLFLRKHTSLALSLPVLVFWMLVYLRTVIADLMQGDLAIVRSCWSGLVDGLAEVRAT
ncbi:MAG: glycosyltransferase family 2 protein [Anaerolineae bacterium]